MNKKKVSVPVITLYALAVIFLLIAAFSVWFSFDYISGLTTTNGFVVSDNLKDVFNYYFTQCAPYFAYAFLLYTGGVIVDRLNKLDGKMEEVASDKDEAVEKEPEIATAETVIENTEA